MSGSTGLTSCHWTLVYLTNMVKTIIKIVIIIADNAGAIYDQRTDQMGFKLLWIYFFFIRERKLLLLNFFS